MGSAPRIGCKNNFASTIVVYSQSSSTVCCLLLPRLARHIETANVCATDPILHTSAWPDTSKAKFRNGLCVEYAELVELREYCCKGTCLIQRCLCTKLGQTVHTSKTGKTTLLNISFVEHG
ncbi:hypothetical protein DdX_20189 [Ditylenchus destructor]|uniref:Uncharacterized protein n=1 Tax=Ditylenchus destructor TaxID=166010 RepID=A0AAD4MHL2_9BILA|nr:hypothetical protein DdX_20189 [Ditylenchus destructor]